MDVTATEGLFEREERILPHRSDPLEEQLRALLERYQGPIYRYLHVLAGDPESALECAQETFVRAYDNLRAGKPVNGQWLYKVARNRAVDELRRRGREDRDEGALESMTAPEQHISGRTAAVRQALDRLSPQEREVLYLFSVDKFKAAEIGAMLGISVDAVRMRVFRARQRFRLEYGDPR